MQATINPGFLKGALHVPPSKSMTQRVLAASLLHSGYSIVQGIGRSGDELAALNIIKQLGAHVENSGEQVVKVKGGDLKSSSEIIDCGESGLASRLFIPIIASGLQQLTISGRGSLLTRPMHPILDTLTSIGVEVQSNDGKLPVSIKGPIEWQQHIEIDGSLSSQYLSGLLIAASYSAVNPVTIHVKDLKSIPYIDMTLEVLRMYGKNISHKNYKYFYIDPSTFTIMEDKEISIESDWSSAAFLMVGAAISGSLVLHGLNDESAQADKEIVSVLKMAQANICRIDKGWHITSSGSMHAFEFDATHCPDLVPVLSVLAIYCNGESSIKGIHRLLHKESNRLDSITDMLQRFDINYYVEDDSLVVQNGKIRGGILVDTHNDHRIAMAASIAALGADQGIVVDAAECVNKSYPDFYSDISSLGIDCTFQ